MRVPHRTVETPGLVGRSLCDARREASQARLRVVVSSGTPGWWAEPSEALRVVDQEPLPHAPIRRRCSVSVVVDGGACDRATVPAPRSGPLLTVATNPDAHRRWPAHGGAERCLR